MTPTHDQDTAQSSNDLAWRLDWNLLRSFMVIMEVGSITEAARRLKLKQPTVSNALRRLEETLGRRLIERGPRSFEPTAHGRALYDQVTQMFGSIERLTALLEEEMDDVSGTVAIAMATHVTTPLIDETLSEFQARYPDTTISITVSSSRSILESIHAKRSAIGICLVRDQEPGLEYHHLFRESFGFFCGPTHRLFGRGDINLEDLEGERSVSFDTDRLEDVLRPVAMLRESASFTSPPAGMSNNLEEVRRMTIAGLGIAALPIHVVDRDVNDGFLWQLPPYENLPEIDIYAVVNPQTQLNRAEQEFVSMLIRKIEATPLEERVYGAGITTGMPASSHA
ncbi:LysR family transcriptional regulator [Hyphococcus sp.]|uniref:LysR family transcriptional regulator n=1 Tax=Hyphococcus sp. TaxID=2038636 RepID=UPI002085C307|nr:MAG: LysR family transcriptional regulator [Marinicaulis sp.]